MTNYIVRVVIENADRMWAINEYDTQPGTVAWATTINSLEILPLSGHHNGADDAENRLDWPSCLQLKKESGISCRVCGGNPAGRL